MHHYPASLRKLIMSLAKLPGIGEKTAERLAMYVLRAPRIETEQLARSILEIKEKVRLCARCFAMSDSEICHLCSDTTRNAAVLCVVEQPADMASIEKSGAYKGCYHTLGGALSPMDGTGPDDIRIRELIVRVKSGQIEEVILATGTNVEGEATASYIASQLEAYSVRVTRIASGVPMGGDLKYVDQVTLKRALESRHAI